jgi:hypothetical protein
VGQDFPAGHTACAKCGQTLRWKFARSSHGPNYEAIMARAATLPEPFTVSDLHPVVPTMSRNDLCSMLNRQAVVGTLTRIARGNRAAAVAQYIRGPKFPHVVQASVPHPSEGRVTRGPRMSPYERAWRAFRATIVIPERPD